MEGDPVVDQDIVSALCSSLKTKQGQLLRHRLQAVSEDRINGYNKCRGFGLLNNETVKQQETTVQGMMHGAAPPFIPGWPTLSPHDVYQQEAKQQVSAPSPLSQTNPAFPAMTVDPRIPSHWHNSLPLQQGMEAFANMYGMNGFMNHMPSPHPGRTEAPMLPPIHPGYIPPAFSLPSSRASSVLEQSNLEHYSLSHSLSKDKHLSSGVSSAGEHHLSRSVLQPANKLSSHSELHHGKNGYISSNRDKGNTDTISVFDHSQSQKLADSYSKLKDSHPSSNIADKASYPTMPGYSYSKPTSVPPPPVKSSAAADMISIYSQPRENDFLSFKDQHLKSALAPNEKASRVAAEIVQEAQTLMLKSPPTTRLPERNLTSPFFNISNEPNRQLISPFQPIDYIHNGHIKSQQLYRPSSNQSASSLDLRSPIDFRAENLIRTNQFKPSPKTAEEDFWSQFGLPPPNSNSNAMLEKKQSKKVGDVLSHSNGLIRSHSNSSMGHDKKQPLQSVIDIPRHPEMQLKDMVEKTRIEKSRKKSLAVDPSINDLVDAKVQEIMAVCRQKELERTGAVNKSISDPLKHFSESETQFREQGDPKCQNINNYKMQQTNFNGKLSDQKSQHETNQKGTNKMNVHFDEHQQPGESFRITQNGQENWNGILGTMQNNLSQQVTDMRQSKKEKLPKSMSANQCTEKDLLPNSQLPVNSDSHNFNPFDSTKNTYSLNEQINEMRRLKKDHINDKHSRFSRNEQSEGFHQNTLSKYPGHQSQYNDKHNELSSQKEDKNPPCPPYMNYNHDIQPPPMPENLSGFSAKPFDKHVEQHQSKSGQPLQHAGYTPQFSDNYSGQSAQFRQPAQFMNKQSGHQGQFSDKHSGGLPAKSSDRPGYPTPVEQPLRFNNNHSLQQSHGKAAGPPEWSHVKPAGLPGQFSNKPMSPVDKPAGLQGQFSNKHAVPPVDKPAGLPGQFSNKYAIPPVDKNSGLPAHFGEKHREPAGHTSDTAPGGYLPQFSAKHIGQNEQFSDKHVGYLSQFSDKQTGQAADLTDSHLGHLQANGSISPCCNNCDRSGVQFSAHCQNHKKSDYQKSRENIEMVKCKDDPYNSVKNDAKQEPFTAMSYKKENIPISNKLSSNRKESGFDQYELDKVKEHDIYKFQESKLDSKMDFYKHENKEHKINNSYKFQLPKMNSSNMQDLYEFDSKEILKKSKFPQPKMQNKLNSKKSEDKIFVQDPFKFDEPQLSQKASGLNAAKKLNGKSFRIKQIKSSLSYLKKGHKFHNGKYTSTKKFHPNGKAKPQRDDFAEKLMKNLGYPPLTPQDLLNKQNLQLPPKYLNGHSTIASSVLSTENKSDVRNEVPVADSTSTSPQTVLSSQSSDVTNSDPNKKTQYTHGEIHSLPSNKSSASDLSQIKIKPLSRSKSLEDLRSRSAIRESCFLRSRSYSVSEIKRNYSCSVPCEINSKKPEIGVKFDDMPAVQVNDEEVMTLTSQINDLQNRMTGRNNNLMNNTVVDVPNCGCHGPNSMFNESVEGPYYTHLGFGRSVEAVRKTLEDRMSVSGKAIRIEKVRYTGREGKSSRGCPIAKWIVRRSSIEEKYLAVLRHRPGHFCDTAWLIIALVAWEGVPTTQADNLYSFLSQTLPDQGFETERRCGTNDRKMCACQGADLKKRGASFSFGCSWSMYFNGCKFARSQVARKFKLKDSSKEQNLETRLQELASQVGPLYKQCVPDAHANQSEYSVSAQDCRLGNEPGGPFSGVTACIDFCAHAHKDIHNMNNGSTVVVTLTKHRGLSKPDDEQLHVLPMYVLEPTDEQGSYEGQFDKIQNGELEVLHHYPLEARIRGHPLTPCKKRRAGAKKSPGRKRTWSPLLGEKNQSWASSSSAQSTPKKTKGDVSFLQSQDSNQSTPSYQGSNYGTPMKQDLSKQNDGKIDLNGDKPLSYEDLMALSSQSGFSELYDKFWDYFYTNGVFPPPSLLYKGANSTGAKKNNSVGDKSDTLFKTQDKQLPVSSNHDPNSGILGQQPNIINKELAQHQNQRDNSGKTQRSLSVPLNHSMAANVYSEQNHLPQSINSVYVQNPFSDPSCDQSIGTPAMQISGRLPERDGQQSIGPPVMQMDGRLQERDSQQSTRPPVMQMDGRLQERDSQQSTRPPVMQMDGRLQERDSQQSTRPPAMQIDGRLQERDSQQFTQPPVMQMDGRLQERNSQQSTWPPVMQMDGRLHERDSQQSVRPSVIQVDGRSQERDSQQSTQPPVMQMDGRLQERDGQQSIQPPVMQMDGRIPERDGQQSIRPPVMQMDGRIPIRDSHQSLRPPVMQVDGRIPERDDQQSIHPPVMQMDGRIPVRDSQQSIHRPVMQVDGRIPEKDEQQSIQPSVMQKDDRLPGRVDQHSVRTNETQVGGRFPGRDNQPLISNQSNRNHSKLGAEKLQSGISDSNCAIDLSNNKMASVKNSSSNVVYQSHLPPCIQRDTVSGSQELSLNGKSTSESISSSFGSPLDLLSQAVEMRTKDIGYNYSDRHGPNMDNQAKRMNGQFGLNSGVTVPGHLSANGQNLSFTSKQSKVDLASAQGHEGNGINMHYSHASNVISSEYRQSIERNDGHCRQIQNDPGHQDINYTNSFLNQNQGKGLQPNDLSSGFHKQKMPEFQENNHRSHHEVKVNPEQAAWNMYNYDQQQSRGQTGGSGQFMASKPAEPSQPDPDVVKCEMEYNEDAFRDPNIGGVAIALSHGAVLFEVAKRELHATTGLRKPNRFHPTRISLVFYQHKNLNTERHGMYVYAKKLDDMKQKRIEKMQEERGFVDMQEIENSFKGGKKRKLEDEDKPKEDIMQTSAAKYRYLLDCNARREETLITDTVSTKWIHPQPMVTGPYQKWV